MVMVVMKEITESVRKQKEQTQALQDALMQAQHANRAKTTFLSKFELFCFHLRLDDVDQIVHQLRNIAFLLFDLHLAALDPAHVKDVVDQAERRVNRK